MSVQSFRAGGFGTDTPSDFIVLWGQVSTSGNVSHFRKTFTTAGYQVTSGKTLYMVKMRMFSAGNTSSSGALKLGYSDNDVGLDTTTARTNPVMAVGLDDTTQVGMPFNPGINWSTTYASQEGDAFGISNVMPIAVSTKYPFMRKVDDGITRSVVLWCVEA